MNLNVLYFLIRFLFLFSNNPTRLDLEKQPIADQFVTL